MHPIMLAKLCIHICGNPHKWLSSGQTIQIACFCKTLLNHRLPSYNSDPRGAVSAEMRELLMRRIMKGRPAKRIILSPSSRFDATRLASSSLRLGGREGRQRPKQVTGRRDGANRRHLPACSNFYLGIICDASTCSPSPGLNPHWSHVGREGKLGQLRV